MSNIKLVVEIDVSFETIQNLLVTAFEGGINHWCSTVSQVINPTEVTWVSDLNKIYDIPLNPGGQLVLEVDGYDGPRRNININTIKDGLTILSNKYPIIFNSIIDGTFDAGDADCFVQVVVFQDIIFS